jgi:DNA polymerase-3 subunit beta
MKFNIAQTTFVKALNIANKSLLTKSNLPILSNILINVKGSKVEIVTTSLETATKVVVDAKVESEGETTLSGRAVSEFVSQLDVGEIIFEKLGEEALVSSSGFKARFSTMAPEEFPAIPKIEIGRQLEIESKNLVEGVLMVAFCAALDESRPILTGILCEIKNGDFSMVATDGFRLGYSEVALVEKEKKAQGTRFVMPARALLEIAKIIGEKVEDKEQSLESRVTMTISDSLNQMVFKIGNVEFTSRLIEGVYPGWEKLIPASFTNKVKLNKGEFVRVIKIASIFARDSGSIVKLKFEGNGKAGAKLAVSSTTAQMGSSESEIAVALDGAGGEIAFNYRYLIEALSAITDDEVLFEMNESLNPGKLTGASRNNKAFQIIMPVRLQN